MERTKYVLTCIYRVLVWPVAIFLIFFVLSRALGTGRFGMISQIPNIMQQACLNAVIAWAMAFNMLNNRWDFSVGGMIIVTSVVGTPIATNIAVAMAGNAGGLALLAIFIIIGVILGLICVAVYLLLRVPSVVTSIGIYMIMRCVMQVAYGGQGAKLISAGGVTITPDITMFARFPMVFVLVGAAMLVFWFCYTKTKFGYNVRSLAYFQGAAVAAGINEKKNAILCYVFMGAFVGIAATINISVSGIIEANPDFNGYLQIMFEAFPSVFIGIYLSRYVNFAVGILVGSVCMRFLTSGIVSLGMATAWQNVGIGIFLLVFMGLTTNQARYLEWTQRRKKAAFLHKGTLES